MTTTLSKREIEKLSSINNCHPATLCVDICTRRILEELISNGTYTIQPEAREAIEQALRDSDRISVPIMPCSEFETVAYSDHLDNLTCHTSVDTTINGMLIKLTAGRSYPLNTGTYKFSENFKRNKVHFNEQTQETYTSEHDCVLSGSDRYIAIKDDTGKELHFMDRPRQRFTTELPESKLWEWFTKPKVNTVTEVCREQVNTNHAVLKACEMLAGYQYYQGQLNFLSRIAVKDAALVAGETGSGKSLMAISLLAMKSPQRALIIAPQGTMRASKVEDEDDEEGDEASMSAAQWLKEINKFAPYLQVFEIFSYEDYERILSLNNGKLPYGVFVTYYEAFFTNGARERAPQSWDDDALNRWAKANGYPELPRQTDTLGKLDKHYHCDSIGKEVEGVRCIINPCLSTLIGHEFDCVLVDEVHRCSNLSALTTEMLIRLQPKFKYALTATPVPNVVTNLFPIMGWLAVPDWYKGNRRNAAWPYAREDQGRFNSTFLTQERDMTQEEHNRRADPKWRGTCIKDSPIISSPARLLKLIKPNLAFISKEECRADYIKPKIHDVRVAMGREQAVLYGHFTNRANIRANHPLVRARKQVAYLRNICADPAGFRHGGPKVFSNMNPKVIAILELVRDILGRGEQVVIINSRVGITSTLCAKLAEAGVPIARIDSTMEAEQHAFQANLFKAGKARVMAMGIKCAAAYSFDQAENLIIGSLEYSWGPFNQACGRIDRVTNAVVKNIYCILHKNSIEEVQFETVSIKADAANLCLRGRRIPRDFRPVDGSEVLAQALDRFDLNASEPETVSEAKWPQLRKHIKEAIGS